jgi:hypothetical protein
MSIFDDYEGILNIPENPRQQARQAQQERQRSVQNIQRRSEAMERELEGQSPIEMIAPGAGMLRGLDMTIGRPTRERMIKALELGGTPVRDERGVTVGVVRRGAGVFGGDDFVGSPDYNPIFARTSPGQVGRYGQQITFMESGGVIRTRALTPTERSMLPGEDGTAATIMSAAPPAPPPPATTGVTGAPELDAAAAAARAEEQVRMQRSRRRGRTATIVGGLLDDAPASGQAPTLLG